MIRVSDHRPLIEALLKQHCPNPSTLEIVEDVDLHAAALGYPDPTPNPFRLARSIGTASGAFHMLICTEITDDQIECAKSLMERNGFRSEVSSLRSEVDFLTHLVLHEVAALVLKTDEQEQRDRWAFTRMGIS